MSGPYPPPYGVGPVGPNVSPESFPQSYPSAQPYPNAGIDATYPGALPPPVQYPRPNRGKWLIAAAAALVVVVFVGVIVAAALTGGGEKPSSSGLLTEASARVAIQEYLDALSNGDDETVARNTLCGLFDAAKERRSDLALAGLSSDAFRRQYSIAEVTSIDKMVSLSPSQAQVLFTMRVEPARNRRGDQPQKEEEQAIAQLLSVDGGILVCSYLPRTTGQY